LSEKNRKRAHSQTQKRFQWFHSWGGTCPKVVDGGGKRSGTMKMTRRVQIALWTAPDPAGTEPQKQKEDLPKRKKRAL